MDTEPGRPGRRGGFVDSTLSRIYDSQGNHQQFRRDARHFFAPDSESNLRMGLRDRRRARLDELLLDGADTERDPGASPPRAANALPRHRAARRSVLTSLGQPRPRPARRPDGVPSGDRGRRAIATGGRSGVAAREGLPVGVSLESLTDERVARVLGRASRGTGKPGLGVSRRRTSSRSRPLRRREGALDAARTNRIPSPARLSAARNPALLHGVR